MAKSATTIDQQFDLLKSRGLTVNDADKAREILLDVGYYRLGFYLFPFEKSYPELRNRTHEYVEGASFEDAVNLYYFDFDLRLLLMRYLNRIEIAFRTSLIYYLSNKYNTTPIWFVSPSVVSRSYARDFERKVYTSDFKRNPVIHRHHQRNPNDRFAPSWKTLEFMTFGAVMKLYEQLKEVKTKSSSPTSSASGRSLRSRAICTLSGKSEMCVLMVSCFMICGCLDASIAARQVKRLRNQATLSVRFALSSI